MPLFAEVEWQPIIAYALVAIAAVWVLRRMWRVFRRATGGGQAGAGGCGGCSQNSHPAERAKAKPLVQLSTPSEKRRPE